MNTNAKVALIFTAAVIAVVVGVIVVAILQRPAPVVPETNPSTLLPSAIREDTHILNEGSSDVVLVEFLDFECEACGAFYPYVESLREEFGEEVTFAFRYFPLPSHGNSVNAAVAVEAASRQGFLEPMYARLFETQAEWGEKGVESQAPLFRQFAEDLGLDLARYDADVADAAVLERVQSDFEDGMALGVDSTPTFFLNDRKVTLSSFEDLRAAIEAELAE